MNAVALWVADLERSAAFYRDVIGVPIEYSDPHEPENVPHYETMWGDWGDAGPLEPHLWFNLYAARDAVSTGAMLSFPVPSIDEVHARASAAGAPVVEAPRAVPWGRQAVYSDPDGNSVTVSEG